jgi:S1-C subfamily serine protease
MPQGFAISCKRVTMTAALLIGLGVVNIAAPAVSFALTQSSVISGPLYFWRGLDMRPLNGAISGAKARQGMVVERVDRGSPAARAKMRSGDIITRLDGIPVGSARALAIGIADHCCGPTVTLSVLRNHHCRNVVLPPPAVS